MDIPGRTQEFVMRGTVLLADGTPLGWYVRAFDKDLRGESPSIENRSAPMQGAFEVR
jgi:hypothetical protein